MRLTGRSVCFKKGVEDFWNVHFSCVMVKGRVVGSNIDSCSIFSGSVPVVLVFYIDKCRSRQQT